MTNSQWPDWRAERPPGYTVTERPDRSRGDGGRDGSPRRFIGGGYRTLALPELSNCSPAGGGGTAALAPGRWVTRLGTELIQPGIKRQARAWW